MPLFLVDCPEDEPITLAQAKGQCLIDEDITQFDEQFENIVIPAARERAEIATWRQMLTARWTLKLRRFPCVIELPKPPLQEVISITYVDSAGVVQALDTDDYVVTRPTGPRPRRGRITPTYGTSWPSVRDQIDAVEVTFDAGYGDTGDSVPPLLRQAMLLDLGALYAHREELVAQPGLSALLQLPKGAFSIYRSFKSRPTIDMDVAA